MNSESSCPTIHHKPLQHGTSCYIYKYQKTCWEQIMTSRTLWHLIWAQAATPQLMSLACKSLQRSPHRPGHWTLEESLPFFPNPIQIYPALTSQPLTKRFMRTLSLGWGKETDFLSDLDPPPSKINTESVEWRRSDCDFFERFAPTFNRLRLAPRYCPTLLAPRFWE